MAVGYTHSNLNLSAEGFPRGSGVKIPPANAGDAGSIPELGRSRMPPSDEARAPQPRSLCSRAQGSQFQSPSGTTTEAHAPRGPHSATREATTLQRLSTAVKRRRARRGSSGRPSTADSEHINTVIKAYRQKPSQHPSSLFPGGRGRALVRTASDCWDPMQCLSRPRAATSGLLLLFFFAF